MKKTSAFYLANKLKISKAKGLESVLKAELISAVLNAVEKENLTHANLAKRSGLPRSSVTGILSGSLQKVTLERILRLIEAVGLSIKISRKN